MCNRNTPRRPEVIINPSGSYLNLSAKGAPLAMVEPLILHSVGDRTASSKSAQHDTPPLGSAGGNQNFRSPRGRVVERLILREKAPFSVPRAVFYYRSFSRIDALLGCPRGGAKVNGSIPHVSKKSVGGVRPNAAPPHVSTVGCWLLVIGC